MTDKQALATGLHPDMPATMYHADPCPAPSLSSSIARILLSQSPRHAWFAHSRLNPAYRREESEAFDLGTAAHAYLLEGKSSFEVIEAPDWRTKAAKEARDQARAIGKTPILAHRWAAVREMATQAEISLRDVEQPIPLDVETGTPEQTLIWEHDGLWFRCRPDWLHDDHMTIDDYKSTGGSANPDDWARTMFGAGSDLQAAFYVWGVKMVFGVDANFRFVVQENYPPYALSVIALGPAAMMLAQKKLLHAIDLWRECVTTDTWPGYPTQTCYVDLPVYEETRWLEREIRDDGHPIGDLL